MKITTSLVVLFLITISTASSQINKGTTEREPGELLVMLKKNINPLKDPILLLEFEARGVQVDYKITRSFNIWLFRFNEGVSIPDKVLQLIKAHPAVELAQFNHKVQERSVPNDPSFNQLWALLNTGQSNGIAGSDIKATEAWDITTSGITAHGDTIVIAVVDGGVDLNHSDLNFKKNWNEIPLNQIDDDNNGYVDDFHGWNAYSNSGNVSGHDHGTHVSGIAAAKTNNGIGVSGVSYNSKVLPIAGSGTNEVLVVSAYDYVFTMRKLYNETNGAAGAYVVASNSSFGIDAGDPTNYPLWGAMYDSMGMVGILNVGSTANRGWDIDIQGDIPTAMTNESIVAVTNTTNRDVLNTQAAWGLNSIDLGAPGTDIYSTRQGNLYGTKTGTSMASPMVSGAIALLYAATDSTRLTEYKEFPSLAVSRFKRYMIATVDTIPSLVGKSVSGGRLNLLNAVMMAATPPMVISTPASINLALKPDSTETITLQLSSTASEPDSYVISLPPDANWISTSITQGVLMPGVPQFINVIINTTGMPEGTYSINISVNDYFLNQLVIPVTLKVDRTIPVREVTTNASIALAPNPFDNVQQVLINLKHKSDVSIKVINLQGKEVASIHKGLLSQGSHTITWNGTNNQNQSVISGVYFIVVTDRFGTVTLKTIKK